MRTTKGCSLINVFFNGDKSKHRRRKCAGKTAFVLIMAFVAAYFGAQVLFKNMGGREMVGCIAIMVMILSVIAQKFDCDHIFDKD